MNITVFTNCEARHAALINALAPLCNTLYVCQEVRTLFPGEIEDFFRKSEVMQAYFTRVLQAQETVFGVPSFSPENVRILAMKQGDISQVPLSWLRDALQSDIYIVFGTSFIRGELTDLLIDRQAINIHMGVSPYYRGSSCNFWALKDNRADMVGATIHFLSKGLDSGPMLFHAVPAAHAYDPFVLGMEAVRAAHEALVAHIQSGDLFSLEPVMQNKNDELRYTRNNEFTDTVAQEYLDAAPTPDGILQQLLQRNPEDFLRLHIGTPPPSHVEY